MKKLFPILLLVLINYGCSTMFMSSSGYNSAEEAQVGPTEQTYQVFYDRLAPFGNWITDPQYGYVWVPNVELDFVPYSTNGHWVYASIGWTWVSNYNWGWAAFHYGRWFFQLGRGWIWIPGHEWGPAWVIWGDIDDYYGWAPMGPGTIVGDGWRPPAAYWNFVPRKHIYQRDLHRYIMDRSFSPRFSNNINIIQNKQLNPFENPNHKDREHDNGRSFINLGPKFEDVQNRVNRNIRPVRIHENPAPAGTSSNRRDLFIYKPPIMHEEAQKQIPNKPMPIQKTPVVSPAPRKGRPERKFQN
ncbi:MAG: hypothetical protein RLZ56_1146 [Bacteroidota bacterium]